MPKAILEFNLPEEQEEHEVTLNAASYSLVISEMDNWLRSKIKYEDKETLKTQEVRDKLHELMNEFGV